MEVFFWLSLCRIRLKGAVECVTDLEFTQSEIQFSKRSKLKEKVLTTLTLYSFNQELHVFELTVECQKSKLKIEFSKNMDTELKI